MQLQEFAALEVGPAGNERYLHAFADDAVLLPPDRPALHGRGVIRKFYDEVFRTVAAGRVIYDDAILDIEGTLAVRRYTAIACIVPTDSDVELVVRTKYLDVLRKRENGDWQITVHTWSTNDDSQRGLPT